MPSNVKEKLDPIRKAAILISTLDHRVADALLERMSEDQAALVRQAVLALDSTPSDVQDFVVREFLRTGEYAARNDDTGSELDDALARKLSSPDGYSDQRESAGNGQPPFRFLREANASAVAKHLSHENPQVAAMVISHLPPERAADVLLRLDARLQAEVLRRIAQLDTADPDIVREVEQHLEALLADEVRDSRNRAAGLSAVQSILQAAGSHRRRLLSRLQQHDQQLAAQLKPADSDSVSQRPTRQDAESPARQSRPAAPPVSAVQPSSSAGQTSDVSQPATAITPAPVAVHFDDLSRLSDAGLAQLFHAADSGLLLLALTGAAPAFVDRLLKQLPPREAKALQHRMEQTGPLRLSDIEEAQASLARLAGVLAARGDLQLPQPRRFAVAA